MLTAVCLGIILFLCVAAAVCLHACDVAVINGEKAAFKSPVFAQKRHRTLDMLVKNIYQEYVADSNKARVETKQNLVYKQQ
jgi:hypothetical protein